MKSILKQTLFIAFALFSTKVIPQIAKVVDLRTGIDNTTGSPIPMGSFDDTWQVSPANTGIISALTSIYQPVKIGNGTYNLGSGTIPYTNLCNNIGWLSPNLNWQGYDMAAAQGVYFYRMSFELTSCSVQNVVLNINCGLAHYAFNYILVNNTMAYQAPNPFPSTLGSMNITLNSSSVQQGTNYVYVAVYVLSGVGSQIGTTGMELDANLTITSCAFVDGTLKDKNGVKKNLFCLNEDAIMDVFGSFEGKYDILLYENTGSGYGASPISSKLNADGNPHNINVTDMFKNNTSNPVVFNTTSTYKAVVKVKTVCGVLAVEKEFSFQCCNNEPDASFTLYKNKNNVLIGKSSSSGNHSWEVYGMSQYYGNVVTSAPLGSSTNNGGGIVPLGQLSDMSLNKPGPCFYVMHTVTNDCGYACSSQQFCNFTCESKECNISTPTNFQLNGNILTWDYQPNAAYFIVQFFACDPTCCGGNNSVSSNQIVSITVPNPMASPVSYQITGNEYANQGGLFPACYSVKVFAACMDGGLSMPSEPKCAVNNGDGGACDGMWGRASGTTNISELNGSVFNIGVDVFPNPATNRVDISILSNQDVSAKITVHNITGRLVKVFDNIKTTNKKSSITWDIEGLPKGVYMLKTETSSGQIINNKLVIE